MPFKYTIIGQGDQFERLIYATHQLKIYEQICFVGIQSKKRSEKSTRREMIFLYCIVYRKVSQMLY